MKIRKEMRKTISEFKYVTTCPGWKNDQELEENTQGEWLLHRLEKARGGFQGDEWSA